ncbi:MAG: hypothetical protein H8K07_06290 [Nitrospira sp.]|jgi:hypothetical protein|nr:hypothetical protein [Nitrospira sp.]MDI3461748.1 hypothetical protein [Nitrospira sp.]
MRFLSLLCLSCLIIILPTTIQADDRIGPRPLRTILPAKLASILPSGTHILIERTTIEAFLTTLEGAPPDWAIVYGYGHHDPRHDERLFNLNRERDAAREGSPVLNWRVAFVWPGELSQFDPETKSYAVAVGPELNSTGWGLVRFKPEEFPSNLRVRPDKKFAARISRSLAKREKVHVLVVMAGVLIPSESIIYDFSHEEEGVGLIMPVVRIEQVEVILRGSPMP